MQRRLVEELKELEENIQAIKRKYNKTPILIDYECCRISVILHSLLKSPDKSFEVVFKDRVYNFIFPSTQEEYEFMKKERESLVDSIINECLNQMEQGNDAWWMVTAFASGIDTLDMQIEIVKEDVVNRVDENGECITALPLDKDNYNVKMQMPTKKEIDKYLRDKGISELENPQPTWIE